MLDNQNNITDQTQPMIYEFRVRGQLDKYWIDWFGNDFIAREDEGDTVLTGPVVDQSALHGLLKKVRDLGMSLISVIHIKSQPINDSINNPETTEFPDQENH